ncbi:MAG: helix-turn-helix domain-containing protein [Coraliomargaritaceae bacterium]
MQSIGERLEEARKRKGISLREAAEATKIRSDFLSHIEQNQFDFDLPNIYKRGFIGNYARYLKLSPDTILTDYESQRLSNSRLGKKVGTEWFGKMEVKTNDSTEDSPNEDSTHPSFGHVGGKGESEFADDTTGVRQPDAVNDSAFYLKVGLIFIGTLSFVFILFILVKSILGGSSAADSNRIDTTAPATVDVSTPKTLPTNTTDLAPETAAELMTLEATGTVYIVVKQKDDSKELFKGTLGAGESTTFERSGKVEIVFTVGEHLIVETNEGRMRPAASGYAKITID